MMSRRGAANVAEALLWSSLLGGNNRGGGGFGGSQGPLPGGPGMMPGGGNWKPVPTDEGPKVFVQKGSKMNDMNFDEETPF